MKTEVNKGDRYGKLTVIREVFGHNKQGRYVECICDCGKITIARLAGIRCGRPFSCGCYKIERTIEVQTKHGLHGHPLYYVWRGIIGRCYFKSHCSYRRYGGRGISVCNSWRHNFSSFYDWAILNGYKSGLTIDRKDYNGNYEPSNCKWVTPKEQANNTRRNRRISINGETKTIPQWADIYGMKSSVLRNRVCYLGWTIEKAITTPVVSKNRLK